jgi:hypothetical protein
LEFCGNCLTPVFVFEPALYFELVPGAARKAARTGVCSRNLIGDKPAKVSVEVFAPEAFALRQPGMPRAENLAA